MERPDGSLFEVRASKYGKPPRMREITKMPQGVYRGLFTVESSLEEPSRGVKAIYDNLLNQQQ